MKAFKFIWTGGMLTLLAAMLVTACGNSTNSAANNATNIATAPKPQVDPIFGHLTHAQPRLTTIKVWLGSEELKTELALKPIEIATGMMFRTNMAENEAMLFVFSDAGPRNFYMRNCTVPLTAAYINPDGVIEEFAKLDPGDTNGVGSKSWNIQYVLELPQGWPERHNVRTGAVVRTERGSLSQTFFRR